MRHPHLLSSLLILGLFVFSNSHCSAGQSESTVGLTGDKPVITLLFVGDTGFNQSRRNVRTDGVIKNGVFQTWQQSVSNIRGDLSGDLMFANVETVVTDRRHLIARDRNQGRGFYFRSHPNGFRQLAELGFNLFSLANNHALDYGTAGLKETLKHFKALDQRYAIAYSGIGMNRESAGKPSILRVKNKDFALSSISFLTSGAGRFRAGKQRPGQLSFRSKNDLSDTVGWLSESMSDFRILSIHFGTERRSHVPPKQVEKWRRLFVRESNIDIVVAHHAHVARGIELTDGKLIFYGLGNFLHQGMANMNSQGICRDFGLVTRVHLTEVEAGKLEIGAVEAIPVRDMHFRTSQFDKVRQSALRIKALNYLSRKLTDADEKAHGLQFAMTQSGAGLYCTPRARHPQHPLAGLCWNWRSAPAPSSAESRRIARACQDYPRKRRYRTSKYY